MIRFKEIQENDAYLEISPLLGYYLKKIRTNNLLQVSEKAHQEANEILNKKIDEECRIGKVIGMVAIPKTSPLAKFLLENTDGKIIINEKEEITYEKIVNAYLIASYEGISIKDILQIYLKMTEEEIKDKLSKNESIKEYVINNPNFKEYLKRYHDDAQEEKEYIVYENGIYNQKYLSKKTKQKVKNKGK